MKKCRNLSSFTSYISRLTSQKGISLIALIITIIVIVILSAITLNGLLGEGGIIDMAKKARDDYNAAVEKEYAILTQSGKGKWKILSPGGGGATYNPIINPYDTKMIITNCDMGGNYISYDGGQSFGLVYLGSPINSTYFVDANTIYMGGNALYKSTDKGKTFATVFPKTSDILAKTYSGPTGNIYYRTSGGVFKSKIIDIKVDEGDKNKVYVLTENIDATTATLYYSDNNCASFDTICTFTRHGKGKVLLGGSNVFIYTNAGISQVDMNAKTLTAKYSGVLVDACEKDGNFYVIKEVTDAKFVNKIYKLSSDFQTETNISDACVSLIPNGMINFVKLDIANDGTLIASTMGSGNFGVGPSAGLLVTKNDGGAWTRHNFYYYSPTFVNTENKSYLYHSVFTGNYPISINICKTDSSKIIFSTYTELYLTGNSGTSWRQLESKYTKGEYFTSTGLDITNARNLTVDPNNTKHMLSAWSDIAIFETYDSGESWRKAKGYNEDEDDQLYGVWNSYGSAFIPEERNKVFSIWTTLHDIPVNVYSSSDVQNAKSYITVSNDGGYNHKILDDAIPLNSVATSIKYLNDKATGGKSLFVTAMGSGVYKSTNLGNSWTQINTGIDASNLYVYDITQDNNNDLYLIITRNLSGKNGKVYKSIDGGQNWSLVNMPYPADKMFPTCVAFDDDNNMYVSFMTAAQYQITDDTWGYGGVYKSSNGGTNWEIIVPQSKSITGITYDNANDALYIVGFSTDLMYYKDRKLNTIDGFTFNKATKVLLIGTDIYVMSWGAGIWKMSTSDIAFASSGQQQQGGGELPENTASTVVGSAVKIPDGKEWNTSAVSAISAGNQVTIPLPKGFHYVGGTLNTGLVISDVSGDDLNNTEGGNQFVWVPCALAASDDYVKFSRYRDTGTWVTKADNTDIGIGTVTYTEGINPDAEAGTIEKDNANMRDNVEKYGGFYVARFEASDSGAIVRRYSSATAVNLPGSRKNAWIYNFITAQQAKECAERLYTSDNTDFGVTSKLISSFEWDTMCKWIEKTSGKNLFASADWASLTDSEIDYRVGTTPTAVANNIYDLAGHAHEKTTEKTTTGGFILRGSDGYAGSGIKVIVRAKGDTSSSSQTFRMTLMIK